MKTFVISDIHGAHKAMMQCLERSGFNNKEDRLICLGDICDGWPETAECVSEIIKIRDYVYIIGNHDIWLLEYLNFGWAPRIWVSQGGASTISSYDKHMELKDKHKDFFMGKKYFYKQDKNLFIHGGFDASTEVERTSPYDMAWDRSLWEGVIRVMYEANTNKYDEKELFNTIRYSFPELHMYDNVFFGHTPCASFKPTLMYNIWNIDTAAGYDGVLTIMDVDSKQYWQSDPVPSLYPNHKGR